MAKVTSKLQITIPKRIAARYGIAPGDEIEFVPSAQGVRLVPARAPTASRLAPEERLRLFDAATVRQRVRQADVPTSGEPAGRGWTREDLYRRGKTR